MIYLSVVAGPIAGRLESLSEAELAWQSAACKQLELLACRELDDALGRPTTRPQMRTVA